MNILQLDDPVLKQIRDEIINLDINNLTQMEALNKLNEIKKHVSLLKYVKYSVKENCDNKIL